ncbi:MAG: methyl-accepting chemotaxis protein [Clostridiales bacterium]|nr:methyl-accepting chemotaxis protein [Clostridiales bacterium]
MKLNKILNSQSKILNQNRMTVFPYDQFAKDYLKELLSPLGEVETSRNIAGEVREIDVWFVPRAQATSATSLGLLGRLATTAGIFEPYRNAIDLEDVRNCMGKLISVCAVAVLLAIIAILLQVRSISNSLGTVKTLAKSLAKGDFTVEPLQIHTQDEVGQMGESLNEMYDSNKNIIKEIEVHSAQMNTSSEKLYHSAVELNQQFKNIETYMNEVNEAMMSASAATQQVNASTEEVNSSVAILTMETAESLKMADEIGYRAEEIEKNSLKSYDHAQNLTEVFNKRLAESIENAKIVENIGSLADVISEIADQINLLSLNASIEAARAGAEGRGFAVVATEIGKLANATSNAVERIQVTITEVNGAYNGLTDGAGSLLDFVKNTVTPDYNNFVSIAKQYEEDALNIKNNFNKISEMSQNISQVINEVTSAIQDIAESAQNTADSSGKVTQAVSDVSVEVESISQMSESQQEIADKLSEVVRKFKLR